MISESENLSYRKLGLKIKNKEYERLDEKTKEKIKKDDKQEITDYIKNPIIIQNKNRYEELSEKILYSSGKRCHTGAPFNMESL